MRMEWGSRALAVVAIVAAAGCAGTKTGKPAATARPDSEIRITRIDRLSWNAPLETNLFHVEFGAALSLDIRRRASVIENEAFTDPFRAELLVMEQEADREFVGRGLCTHGAAIISRMDGAADSRILAGHFRCRSPGLF